MGIGDVIRKYRKEHGLSLREFAEKAGLSHSYIDKLESGKDPLTGKPVMPTMRTIEMIAKAMGVTVEQLMAAAGYLPKNTDPGDVPVPSPKARRIIDSLARAHDLDDDDYEEIADHVERLIAYARKKKEKYSRKSTKK
jgi:transcriptional regulator with XRE-family HTH domain